MKYLLTIALACFFCGILFAQSENQPTMETWNYPYEVHTLALDDTTTIAYVDEGEGSKTLLFVHGLGSYLRAWDKNISVLSKDYRCIAVDLPGYGKSSKGNYAFDMQFFAQALQQFIQQLDLKEITLVGHSMGGQIAMHVVLDEVAAVEKLVLLAPAGFEVFTDQEKAWFKAVLTPAVVKATPEPQIIKNFEINFFEMPEDARFMIADRLAMRATADYDAYCEMIPKCVNGMLEQPVFDQLASISVPTLVMYGEADALIPNRILHPTLTPVAVAEKGQALIPNSKLVMVPKAGHFVQWDGASVVNEAIKKFIE